MLSIVLPCYNDGIKLHDSLMKLTKYLATENITDYEIIVVNDGSTNNTWENDEDSRVFLIKSALQSFHDLFYIRRKKIFI